MATDVNTKILRLKALLGDQPAMAALNAAEEREVAAEALGVKSKEVTTTKDENDESEALSLSALLDDIEQEIEAGLADGTIVDDVKKADEDEDVKAKETADDDEELALKELEAFVAEIADKRFQANVTRLKELFVPREQERQTQIEDLRTALKEAQDQSAKIQAALDELNGIQPKRTVKGYRASADTETVVTDKSRIQHPAADPMDDFLKNFVMG